MLVERIGITRLSGPGLLGVLLLALVLVAVLAPPAQAHQVCQYHGNDWACVTDTHNTMVVCDVEADGNVTVVEYWSRYGTFHRLTDGGDPGCAGDSHPNNIDRFRVCESDPFNCQPWKSVT